MQVGTKLKIALFGVLAFASAVLAWLLQQRLATNKLAVATAESYHTTAIVAAKSKADALSADAATHQVEVYKLQAEIETRKAKLTNTYTAAGMSSNEIAAKLAALHI